MRKDPTTNGTAAVKAVPWDNEGLRNRLQGHQVDISGLSELHDLARTRADEAGDQASSKGRRRSRRSK
jgi:hypothetical protein